jgi:hypothetical protein
LPQFNALRVVDAQDRDRRSPRPTLKRDQRGRLRSALGTRPQRALANFDYWTNDYKSARMRPGAAGSAWRSLTRDVAVGHRQPFGPRNLKAVGRGWSACAHSLISGRSRGEKETEFRQAGQTDCKMVASRRRGGLQHGRSRPRETAAATATRAIHLQSGKISICKSECSQLAPSS